MQQHDIGRGDQLHAGFKVLTRHRGVGAGHRDDRVLAIVGHGNHGKPRRQVGDHDRRLIDPRALKVLQRCLRLRIIADGTDHRDIGTQQPSSDRLVRPLPARGEQPAGTHQRFPRVGVARHTGGQVRVNRTNDDNLLGTHRNSPTHSGSKKVYSKNSWDTA